MVSYLSFPENIGTAAEQVQHWMHIRAFAAGATNNETTVTLFVPGGPQNGSLSWKTVNDYAEVAMTKAGANILGIGGVVATLNLGAQTLAGGAINPKVEVLFRTSQLRQFQFNFMFAPVSQQESESMEEIIKTLRAAAAPELDGNDPAEAYVGGLKSQYNYLFSGLYMEAPSEFLINFYFNGEENKHLPKSGRSVIERIDVDYTPQGEFSTFSNGYPVSAMLTVVFREIRIIDKRSIMDKGY